MAKPNTVTEVQPTTVRDWFYHYLNTRGHLLREQTLKSYNQAVRNALGHLMDRGIESISADEVQDLYASLRSTGKRGRANMALRVLRLIFNYAGCFQSIHNPVKRLGALRLWERDPRRETFIKPTQMKEVWAAIQTLEPIIRDWYQLALLTGMRHQEIMTLKKDQIDLAERILIIPPERAKNHKRHVVPLSDFVVDILKRRIEAADGVYLFPGRFPNTHASSYRESLPAAGYRFNPHDMRRTYLTFGHNLAGVDKLTLKRLVNHATTDVTDGYIIGDLEVLRQPQQAVTDKILELAGVRKQEEKKEEMAFSDMPSDLQSDILGVMGQTIRSLKHQLQIATMSNDFARIKEVSDALCSAIKTQQALKDDVP